MALQGTPIFILKEGTERTRGKDALENNISAARAIAESIRTALGPRGLDKMLTDSFGDVTITNDGATILKEMDVSHPVAKFIVELAKSQDDEEGDGTTSVVVIAGELLKMAESQIEENIHPTVIVEGYRLAAEEAKRYLDEFAKNVNPDDRETLLKIAMTAMGSKVIATSGEFMANIIVDAILSVAEGNIVELDDVKVEKKSGGSLADTELIEGILLDKEFVHPSMPTDIEDAKVALVEEALEISKTEFDAELSISSPDQIKSFMDRETEMIREMVDYVKNSGATALLCSKGIDDVAQHLLAKGGVAAVRRIKKSDMEKLSKATGAKLVSRLSDLTADDLGTAGHIYQKSIADDKMIYVTDCPNAKSVTILIRGGTELVVDEADRAIHDALCVVRDVVRDGKVVAGGGSPEIAISNHLHEFANSLTGREQLAVKAFAEALEVIPRTLAENTGLDPIDVMSELKNKSKGSTSVGIDPIGRVVRDFSDFSVVEPASVKRQAISAAAEAAQMILRIDDVISAKDLGGGGPGGPGGPPGGDEDFD
jgi:thermosome